MRGILPCDPTSLGICASGRAYSHREFASKNSIVLKEAREARYWLRLIAAQQLAPLEEVEPLLAEADELVAIFIATVRSAKASLGKKE